jgi:class 3 adenylate cyclase/tetratricopeptide (TPR) repeat protein
VNCSSCGFENSPGRRFCGECGRPLAVLCPACGSPNDPVKFCGQCGALLSSAPQDSEGRTSERRLVSVLFADLVGFTTHSELRDPDEVRDLLSRYFETSRILVARYGGTVEKFIGDAVMAVWGTPVAQEDDAERAVRAALDLTRAVAELGHEVGWPDLRARAGVLTGEASVTIGATGEGMVAGDLVNTASRIQSAASPGSVYVGDATHRATEAAVAYEDAGLHELKGKAEPVRLWRAMRVVAMRGGALRSEGLEAPFVGRDAELRTVKDLFHASAEQRKAHMVSVVGIAGIGKSRLSWEFYKYIDGLLETIRWHRGRCLAYGEGVTYWALAEMVRSRAGILEAEDQGSARAKLHSTVEEHVPDSDERSWVESRLAHLLALEERTAREPEDLFGAWRLFFERMADKYPVVLVFEDLQWADPSLLDFIDYLLNWSRSHPVFVLSLARPEVADRFPAWAAGRRGVSHMYLDPLERDAMEELLAGLAPGLPEAVVGKVLDRAEGVPLYAVETVRMLLDRGLLVQEGSVYRPTGPIGDLDVPETLHALIAARLDGLPAEERAILQDATVIGKAFSVPALSAVSGRAEPSLVTALSSLVRKEMLSVQADPRSPERGQYAFLQDLVRRVAYDTLSRRDRKARHLAAAAHLEAQRGEENEIAEVLASHYLEAERAAPDAPDAPAIKAMARDALIRAATRSESLAARREALGYFEQAAELTDEPKARADLLSRAGQMAFDGGLVDRGRELFDRAIEIAEQLGDDVLRARIEIPRAFMSTADGRLEDSAKRLRWVLDVLSKETPGADLAKAAAEFGRLTYFLGHPEEGLQHIEVALPIAERLFIPELLSQALNTKGIILRSTGRVQEGLALLRHALGLALEHDAAMAALRAYNNLASTLGGKSGYQAELDLVEAGLALARKVGVAGWEAKFLADRVAVMAYFGRWDEALLAGDEVGIDPEASRLAAALMERTWLVLIHGVRGDFGGAEAERHADVLDASEDIQAVSGLEVGLAWIHFYSGRYEEAIAAAVRSIETRSQVGMIIHVEASYVVGADAALASGDVARARSFLDEMDAVPAGEVSPYLSAHLERLNAKVAAREGHADAAGRGFQEAVESFRKQELRFELAVALAEQGDWLDSEGKAEEAGPLLAEAEEIFEGLRATWWLDRLRGRSATVNSTGSQSA